MKARFRVLADLPRRSWIQPVAVAVVIGASLSAAALAQDAVRIPQDAAMKEATRKVAPKYPAMAKQMKLSGQAELDLYVDTSGSVEKVEVVKGNPILTNAAKEAAKEWKFNPFKSDGSPTKAIVRVAFSFSP